MDAVETADFVVRNPTHVACALKYNQEEMESPKLVAKGTELFAKKIIDGYNYGMKELGEVSEYFDHDFYSEIIGVYNHLLADRRQHPLSWRKYMWKFKY